MFQFSITHGFASRLWGMDTPTVSNANLRCRKSLVNRSNLKKCKVSKFLTLKCPIF